MREFDENRLRILAEELMLELGEDEVSAIKEEFDVLQKHLEFLAAIDTENVEEMIYPIEEETTFLREDEVTNVLTIEQALSNAKRKRKEYIVLPRVVK